MKKISPPLVYLAGPYTSDPLTGEKAYPYQKQNNISTAWDYGLDVALMRAMPMIPHTNSANMDGIHGRDDYDFWIAGTLEWMRRCDAVFMIPGWEASNGARGERQEASDLGIPVFESFEDLDRWVAKWYGEELDQDG